MGLLDFITRKQAISTTEQYSDAYLTERIGSFAVPDKLTESTAFQLANSVAEIYFPIDYLADRASKLRFYIADKNGLEVENTELSRFVTNINPLYSFGELMYQSVFSYLADGNIIQYVRVPESYRNVSINNITRLDVLQPNLVSLREYTNVSELTATSVTDFIKEARYNSRTKTMYDPLRVDRLRIFRYDFSQRETSGVLALSPLFKATRSINNLLATYSARYNVYVNNGAAGYLSKKQSTAGMDAAFGDRDKILEDLNNRNGLTGNRRLWGVSSVPVEWVNTLVTIKDLLPFEETLEDSIKIAAVFQVPSGLIPRKDQSTFDNQDAQERIVWENTLISLVDTMCDYFTRSLTLDQAGYKIKADYTSVSVLKTNDAQVEQIISAKLQNLKTLKELSPETDIKNEIDKIVQGYESR